MTLLNATARDTVLDKVPVPENKALRGIPER
jgi:hypothetical protein